MDMSLSKLWEAVKDREACTSMMKSLGRGRKGGKNHADWDLERTVGRRKTEKFYLKFIASVVV